MFPLWAALISGLGFTGVNLALKRGVPAGRWGFLVPPAWLGLLLPVWVGLFLMTWLTGWLPYAFGWQALWPMLSWLVIDMISISGLTWLLQTYSLSEVAGYKKAFITLGALAVDVWLFGLAYSPARLLAVALLLGGALLLSRSRNRLPSWRELAVIVVWCGLMTTQISFYKTGLLRQAPGPAGILAYEILAQGCYALASCGLWLVPAVRQSGLPALRQGVPLWLCFTPAVLIEGFAYAGLPLAIVLLLTTLPAALFAAHDLWRRDLPRQASSYVALGLILTGFALLVFG